MMKIVTFTMPEIDIESLIILSICIIKERTYS